MPSSSSARARAASGSAPWMICGSMHILAARRNRAADGGTGRRSRARRGEAAVRPSSSSSAASRPAMRIEPSNPPSSRPTACSRVDLPEPDGPSSATISPGCDVEVDAAQHLDGDVALGEAALEPAGLEDRLTHSAAPGPGRCWPPSAPGRGSRGTSGPASIDDDRRDLERVGLRRQLGQEADRRVPQILAGHELDEVRPRPGGRTGRSRRGSAPRTMPSEPMVTPTVMKIFSIARAARAHGPQDGDVAGLGADQHDQRRSDVERRDQDDDATARRTSRSARSRAPRTAPSSSAASRR